MFQQMDEETFQRLRDESGLCVNDAMRVLEELHLYRELGTLQQLSYATDAVGELRDSKDECDRLKEVLHEINTSVESTRGELQDMAKLALEENP